jgi:uncharacterized protein
MREFGKNEYKQTAYFNLENTTVLHSIFQYGFDTNKIISALNVVVGFQINPTETLIIFDEIQACPNAITSLKYFNENNPEYFIFAAGSLLGVAIHHGVSFPVCKVEFLTLQPINFHEFLHAIGKVELLNALQKTGTELIEIFKEQYIELLKQYYIIGGMPEAVNDFSKNNDYNKVRLIQ